MCAQLPLLHKIFTMKHSVYTIFAMWIFSFNLAYKIKQQKGRHNETTKIEQNRRIKRSQSKRKNFVTFFTASIRLHKSMTSKTTSLIFAIMKKIFCESNLILKDYLIVHINTFQIRRIQLDLLSLVVIYLFQNCTKAY